ncbi:hypothetical protein AVEN_39525-1 [Araneus ventricosus]|uniref:Uncharacterized protein n=1 Tax=Araneus ventricosus TaxID=182803 RepID=A0A4Y2NI79_ARAVE|nr:hypothetical protein AVEN_39525-1 [Araneus ventricosus]
MENLMDSKNLDYIQVNLFCDCRVREKELKRFNIESHHTYRGLFHQFDVGVSDTFAYLMQNIKLIQYDPTLVLTVPVLRHLEYPVLPRVQRMIRFPRENSSNLASHLKLDTAAFVPKQSEKTPEVTSQSQLVATGLEKGKPKNVFLSTIRALVKNKFSDWIEVRCLRVV